jgi:hypothetical protein
METETTSLKTAILVARKFSVSTLALGFQFHPAL